MEILFKVISFLFLCVLLIIPLLLLYALNKRSVKYKFIVYIVFGLLLSGAIMFGFAWWADASYDILLAHYGYNFDAMDDIDRFSRVSSEHMARVKDLESSMLGIGWPVKAMFACLIYAPYLLFAYIAVYLINKIKQNKEQTSILEPE